MTKREAYQAGNAPKILPEIGDELTTLHSIPATPFALPAESIVVLVAVGGVATKRGRQRLDTPMRYLVRARDGRELWADWTAFAHIAEEHAPECSGGLSDSIDTGECFCGAGVAKRLKARG